MSNINHNYFVVAAWKQNMYTWTIYILYCCSSTMPFRFVYRTDDISLLLSSRNEDSADISAIRYTHLNDIVVKSNIKVNNI